MYRVQAHPGEWIGENYASTYLGTVIDKLGNTDLAVFTRRQMPYTATHYPSAGSLDGSEELRYWSLCLGYRDSTRTIDCVNDSQVPTGVYSHRVVIGEAERMVFDRVDRKWRTLKRAVEKRGDSLLTWGDRGNGATRMLNYRDAMAHPSFEGNLANVAPCHPAFPEQCVPASTPPPLGVGDWSPEGKHCTISDYLSDNGACDVE